MQLESAGIDVFFMKIKTMKGRRYIVRAFVMNWADDYYKELKWVNLFGSLKSNYGRTMSFAGVEFFMISILYLN